jgi:hypothetical protein
MHEVGWYRTLQLSSNVSSIQRAGGVAQVREALSSNPRTTKTNKILPKSPVFRFRAQAKGKTGSVWELVPVRVGRT